MNTHMQVDNKHIAPSEFWLLARSTELGGGLH